MQVMMRYSRLDSGGEPPASPITTQAQLMTDLDNNHKILGALLAEHITALSHN
jgi:hypothetical protein